MAKNRAVRHRGRTLVLAAAADGPDRKQLIADCASGEGKCSFNEPVLGKAYLGDFR
ncbi:hypothetical protein [Streptomyces sp. NPDC017529]|uniref:hypothetical protein n=1 Tax=Streptomyces sp. NPDC017529 TaxID=3365000 RepID=UPI00379F8544